MDVAVPTPFATELPPIKTGQHLEAEQAVQIMSRHTESVRKSDEPPAATRTLNTQPEQIHNLTATFTCLLIPAKHF